MQYSDYLEYLYSDNDIDFYIRKDYGFELKELALENKLYENFGRHKSIYLEMLKGNIYQDNLNLQVWAFDNTINKPIGLYTFFDLDGDTPTGTIHLYTSPAYRFKGLSAQAVTILDEKISEQLGQYHIILKDDAKHLEKYISNNTTSIEIFQEPKVRKINLK